jgi:cytochrome c
MFGMDTMTINKIAGAVIGSGLLVMGLNIVSDSIYHAEKPEVAAIKIDVPETDAAAESEAKPMVSIASLLATADASKGEGAFKACQACHTAEKGGANKVGPHLWDIVNRPIASVADFTYDEALTSKSSDKWTFENLNEFIRKPKAFAPGTKMGFGGIGDDAKRADLLAYLRTLADAPAELPAPEAAATAAPATAATAETAAPATQVAAVAGDPVKGEAAFRACKACHSGEKGGPNKVGPHLWDVVNRSIASVADYNYDDALKSKSAEKWTPENLDAFIKKPKDYAPGTKMTFGGISDDGKRADLIAYLRSLSDNPQ